MRHLKELIKANSFYLVINLISGLSAILLIPLYVSDFTVQEYGTLALMNVSFSFLMILVTFNMESAIQTFFFDHSDEEQKVNSYFQSTFSFAVLAALGWLGLLLLIGPYLFDLAFSSDTIQFYPNGLIVIVSSAFAAINQMYYVLLRNQERIRRYGRFILISTFLNLSLQGSFIVLWDMGVTGALAGLLITNAVIFTYIVVSTQSLTLNIKWSWVKPSLKYSSWLLPFLIIQWFLAKGDRVIVENYISLEAVGIYALLMNVSMIISLVATSILNSIRPTLFRAFKQQALFSNKKVGGLFVYFLLVILLTSVAVFVFVQFIDQIQIFEEYVAIRRYILLALALFTIRVTFRFCSEYLSYLKKSKDLSLLSIVNLITFVALIILNIDNLSLKILLEISLISNTVMFLALWIRIFQLRKTSTIVNV